MKGVVNSEFQSYLVRIHNIMISLGSLNKSLRLVATTATVPEKVWGEYGAVVC